MLKCCLVIASSLFHSDKKNGVRIPPVDPNIEPSDLETHRIKLGKAGVTFHFLYFSVGILFVYAISYSSFKYLPGDHRVDLGGKNQSNHNFHGQKKTPIGENESIYFYPDRVQHDSKHGENTTSYKINYPLWQRSGECSCQQETKNIQGK